ncbi:hypothetical protein PTKIN_Ptkin03bG0124600 [Pterospermum kingtungense]
MGPIIARVEDLMAQDLILADLTGWNTEVVGQIFIEAEEIFKLSFSINWFGNLLLSDNTWEFLPVKHVLMQRKVVDEYTPGVRQWRNKEVMKGIEQDANTVVLKAFEFLNQYTAAQVRNRPLTFSGVEKWSPLAVEFFKINVDGAYRVGDRFGGVDIVIRDYEGQVIGATCKAINRIADVESLEALAVVHGLRFAKDLGIFPVIVEGDSLSVISAITTQGDILSIFGNYIDEVQLLTTDFLACRFQHVRRSALTWSPTHWPRLS